MKSTIISHNLHCTFYYIVLWNSWQTNMRWAMSFLFSDYHEITCFINVKKSVFNPWNCIIISIEIEHKYSILELGKCLGDLIAAAFGCNLVQKHQKKEQVNNKCYYPHNCMQLSSSKIKICEKNLSCEEVDLDLIFASLLFRCYMSYHKKDCCVDKSKQGHCED